MVRLLVYRLAIACAFALPALSHAAAFTIAGQAGCVALSGAAWNATTSTCTLGADLAIGALDTLTVASPARLAVPGGVILANQGTLRIQAGAQLQLQGGTVFHLSGLLDNDGIVDLRGSTSALITSEGSTTDNGNQVHLIQGRIDNYGLWTQKVGFASFRVSLAATLRNFGTFQNVSGRLFNEGRVENPGAIANGGTMENHCGVFLNTGTFTGNALVDPHCWLGGAGAWSTASRWSHGTVPPANGQVVIDNGTATLDGDLTFTGTLLLDLGHLVVAPGVTLTNRGVVTVTGGGNFPGTTSVQNHGVFINEATLRNGNHFVNVGTFANMGSVQAGGSTGIFINSGTWGNQPGGTVRSQGIDNAATGLMVNYGTIQLSLSQNLNAGRIVNFGEGVLTLDNMLRNRTGGAIFNQGTLNVTHNLTFPAGIANESGARVQNETGGLIAITAPAAYVNNAGLVRNDGSVSNNGMFNNTGVVCGTGTVTGNGIAGNAPVSGCLPTASAGADQSAGEGTLVTLDGTGSGTPKGTALSYAWTQTAGPAVVLDRATPSRPTFTAPYVSATSVLSFRLVVNDGYDSSGADFVDVMVSSTNSPPVADAGDDRTAKPGTAVALDSSNSFDPEGDAIVIHEWTQVAGPPVTLMPGAGAPNPTFAVPDAVGTALVFKLRVSDGKESSVPSAGTGSSPADTVAVTIVQNSRPVAVVGADRAAAENALVLLDGGASHDDDAGDILRYEWRQVAGPEVLLENATSPTATFTAPFVAAGLQTTLTFELVVRDDDAVNPLASSPAVINVGVYNVNDPPRCDLASPGISSLSPPDGRMSTVAIMGVADDGTSGLPFVLRITGVRQDEPVSGLTRADPSPDAVIEPGTTADTVQLRRERHARGNGRVYTIEFTAHDGWEGCSGTVKVGVPVRRNDTAVDDGPVYDSTGN